MTGASRANAHGAADGSADGAADGASSARMGMREARGVRPAVLTRAARMLARRPAAARAAAIARLPDALADAALHNWPCWAHRGQLPPPGDWSVWLTLAGRGFGKTRAGAEWVGAQARADGSLRIALVGGTIDEARDVMVEGASGLLRVGPPAQGPRWLEAKGRLVWPSGAQAFLYSGANPEGLRGPEHHLAWCDEIAKWSKAEEAWANLQLGLRLGPRPRVLATTTPRPTALMRRLLADARIAGGPVAMTRGRTGDNPALSPTFEARMREQFAGTRLERQELDGEMVEDVEGSLFPRDVLEACRVAPSAPGDRSGFVRVVVGVDPPASATGDACGIVVAGLRGDGTAVVVEDATVAGLSPDGWAARVADAAARWSADRVTVETNQGGDMVGAVLRAADARLPFAPVHATRAKASRAEPISTHYARGRVRHAGAFGALEDQLAGLTAGRGYAGPGRSPDRADACVWALWTLLEQRGRWPRVVRL